jgi:hypothetical protein
VLLTRACGEKEILEAVFECLGSDYESRWATGLHPVRQRQRCFRKVEPRQLLLIPKTGHGSKPLLLVFEQESGTRPQGSHQPTRRENSPHFPLIQVQSRRGTHIMRNLWTSKHRVSHPAAHQFINKEGRSP